MLINNFLYLIGTELLIMRTIVLPAIVFILGLVFIIALTGSTWNAIGGLLAIVGGGFLFFQLVGFISNQNVGNLMGTPPSKRKT